MPARPDASATDRPLFGPDRRLRKQRDIDAAFRQGAKVVNRRLVVWLRPATTGRSRLGLSVSRKVGGAVERNRVKRCLREAFRHLAPGFPEPLDAMIVVRPAAPPTSLAEAAAALDQIMQRHRHPAPGRPRRPHRRPDGGGRPASAPGERPGHGAASDPRR